MVIGLLCHVLFWGSCCFAYSPWTGFQLLKWPLKVIWTSRNDMVWMTTYGFLLANHSSYGPILYCFWDMLTCWISLYFVLCLYLMPTLRVTLLKFKDAVYYLDKLEWWSYEVVKNVKRYMQLFRHNTSVWQTDRQKFYINYVHQHCVISWCLNCDTLLTLLPLCKTTV